MSKFLVTFFLIIPSLLLSQVPVFDLTYSIKVNGISCGTMTFALQQESDGQYEAKQAWKSKILFFHLDQVETAHFERFEAGLRPISYTFERYKSGDKKKYTFVFDRSNQDSKQSDRLSLQFFLIQNLASQSDIELQEMTIVDDKGHYAVKPTLEYDNSLVIVSFKIKSRSHKIVFDKSHHYLPVKFVQKRGGFTFEGSLEESTIDSTKWWY